MYTATYFNRVLHFHFGKQNPYIHFFSQNEVKIYFLIHNSLDELSIFTINNIVFMFMYLDGHRSICMYQVKVSL